jgi:hypothetical protein
MATIDLGTRLLVKALRDGRPLTGFCGGYAEDLQQWTFTPAFRVWLADYLEAGNPVPPWLTSRERELKVAPALPVS